jgi:hypothetical protein
MLDSFLEEFSIRVEPVTVEQGRLALQAFNWFGKGKHRAQLNFGDCFTWALAKAYRERVLYKGRILFIPTSNRPAECGGEQEDPEPIQSCVCVNFDLPDLSLL